MKIGEKSNMLQWALWCILVLIGYNANALSYDYTASIECLASPHKPQYNGGIIVNPELNDGLTGWSKFGNAKIQHKELGGNKFIVAHTRTNPFDSVSQKLYLQKNLLYTFSAWIQVSKGSNIPVRAVFKTKTGTKHAGAIVAESNCWSMLKGGLTVDASGFAQLYFESNNISVEIWVDSISLQPFTEKQWKSHQVQTIEKTKKAKVRIQAVDKQNKPLSNATITISQKKSNFPFGCSINNNILSNTAYQNWFTSRFKVTVFENELKWYSTESTRGQEYYAVADSLFSFAKKNNILVRGHNVFWDDPKYQPSWVKSLSPTDLSTASLKRINSVMSRYKGQVIGWDVVNENMHFNFFESKLGQDASSRFYNLASQIDGTATLFLNEYNTIEDNRDGESSPAKYLQKLREIRGFPGNGNLKAGIGLESHFGSGAPNIPYMRASIDTLAATNLPIWLTEIDVQSSPSLAQYLEQILREGYSHPKVNGVVLWSAWSPGGCYRMCLTDNNFKNFPAGDVVDKLLAEFKATSITVQTDSNGYFETSLIHGDYNFKIHQQTDKKSSLDDQNLELNISSTHKAKETLVLQFTV